MSKQSEAKTAQGYTTAPKNCGNCASFQYDLVLSDWMRRANASRGREVYTLERDAVEVNKRCGLGGFAIRKTATCNFWVAKEEA